MDVTTKKIIGYLDSADHELSLSSLRVLTELGGLKGTALKSIDKLLAEGDSGRNRRILEVLSLKPCAEFIPYYLVFLKDEERVREKALMALQILGSVSSQIVQKQYKEADPLLKQSFIALLGRVPNRSNFQFLTNLILVEPRELLIHMTNECLQAAKQYPDKDKKVFEALIREHVRIAEKNKNERALISYAILLGGLGLKSSLGILMRYAESKYSVDLRRHALVSIAKIAQEGKIDESFQKMLLMLLSEADFANIVQNALAILEPIPSVKSFEKVYLELMTTNPHNAVKNYSLGKLAQLNSKVALEKLTSQLISGDVFLYEKAQKVLEQSDKGIKYLMDNLDNISTSEAAERVGSLLAMDRTMISRAQLELMFKKAEKHLGEANEKARIYFTLIRRINPDVVYENTIKRVGEFKSKKLFVKARALLELLAGTLLFNTDAKFEHAVVTLKISNKVLDNPQRNQDAALLLFQTLIPLKNFGLIEKIKKEKILSPEDYFYLGYHFSEKLFDQKDFGIQVLRCLVEKFKTSPFAKRARKKLELLGIPVSGRELRRKK